MVFNIYNKLVLREVAEPTSQGEKAFKAMHDPEKKNLVPGETDQENLYKGEPVEKDKSIASSQDQGKDEQNYDKGLKIDDTHQTPEIEASNQKKQALSKFHDEQFKPSLGYYVQKQLNEAAEHSGMKVLRSILADTQLKSPLAKDITKEFVDLRNKDQSKLVKDAHDTMKKNAKDNIFKPQGK